MSQQPFSMDVSEDWFQSQGVPGYAPQGGGVGMPAGDMNQAGAGSDPFAYTNGSLLTPWTKKFEWSGGTAGAYTPPELARFSFGQAPGANIPRIEAMTMANQPDFAFKFDQNEDPGAKYRLEQSQKALENSAAARGTLLTGGTMARLQENAQGLASQEFGNSFNRALQTYGTNLNKEFGTFDRNWGSRLGAGQANIQAATAEAGLNQGAWDRNYGMARTQWQDAADAANRAASASAGNSAASFNQALAMHKMEQGDFFENQDRQYSKLMGLGSLGMGGASQLGAYGGQYGANAGNIYGQAGNAAAAGQIGSGNAWASALGGIGNAAMNYGMYRATGGGRQA
jgi:hypothetical protein